MHYIINMNMPLRKLFEIKQISKDFRVYNYNNRILYDSDFISANTDKMTVRRVTISNENEITDIYVSIKE